MQTGKADAFIHQSADGFQAVLLQQCMSATAVAVNNDSRHAFKCTAISWPTVGINDRRDSGDFIQARLQQQRASPVFVMAGTVAGFASDKNNFFVCG